MSTCPGLNLVRSILLLMTSNLLENMQVYLLTQAGTRYCMIYFGNSSKIETCF